jgi:hypothetical protein
MPSRDFRTSGDPSLPHIFKMWGRYWLHSSDLTNRNETPPSLRLRWSFRNFMDKMWTLWAPFKWGVYWTQLCPIGVNSANNQSAGVAGWIHKGTKSSKVHYKILDEQSKTVHYVSNQCSADFKASTLVNWAIPGVTCRRGKESTNTII